jgi:hypothetical protein
MNASSLHRRDQAARRSATIAGGFMSCLTLFLVAACSVAQPEDVPNATPPTSGWEAQRRQAKSEAIDRMITALLRPVPPKREDLDAYVSRVHTRLCIDHEMITHAQWARLLDGVLHDTDLPRYSLPWYLRYCNILAHLPKASAREGNWKDEYFGIYSDAPDTLPNGYDLPVFADCQSLFTDVHPYQRRYYSVSVRRADGTWEDLGTRSYAATAILWSDKMFMVPREHFTVKGDSAEVTLRLDASIGKEYDFKKEQVSHGAKHKVSREVTHKLTLAGHFTTLKSPVLDAKADGFVRTMRMSLDEDLFGRDGLPMLQLWGLYEAWQRMAARGIDTLAVTLSLECGGNVIWTHDTWHGKVKHTWRAGEESVSYSPNYTIPREVMQTIKTATEPVSLRVKSNPTVALRDFVGKTYWLGEVVIPDIKQAPLTLRKEWITKPAD